ncbi:MAG: hypothetical protein JSV68_15830 [Anaerolineaceae bacterium]|nr:MAG: hypothetical protein JSV68_15830 [Anaerolineaceae bacterium]
MIFSSRRHLTIRYVLLFTGLFLFTHETPFLSAYTSAPQQIAAIEDLWIDMRIGPPLVPLFNAAARENDIARVEHPSQVGQLNEIKNGRKMVIFKSVEETERLLPDMASEIDIIGYNLEHGPATPAREQQDPVESIQKMRELADAYDLELAFGPDHDFALSHGVDIAPFVDIFVLQIQRQQTKPQIVAEFVEPLVPQLREANPDVEISVQVRTEGDVGAIVDLIGSLSANLDGISILTSPETVDVAQDLTIALRPNAATPSQRLGRYSTIIILAVAGLILLAGVLIYRRRQAAKGVNMS